MEVNHLARHFKNEGADPVLCEYIEKGYERLLDGHIVTPVSDGMKELKQSQLVSQLGEEGKPFVLDNNRFYFQRYYAYESDIVNWIKTRIELNKASLEKQKEEIVRLNDIINKLFEPTNELDWQRIGAINCFLNNFAVISGGPGTGKTRTVARFLGLYFSQKPQSRVALVAQTGKAAARLKESLDNQKADLVKVMGSDFMKSFDNITSSTIHRILGRNINSLGAVFKHGKENSIPYDLVILDEASMIDLPLMAKLLTAIHPNTKVIMMGDKNQLSSVEAGSVFGDLCDALKLNQFSNQKIELFKNLGTDISTYENDSNYSGVAVQFLRSFRFNENEGIGAFSKGILSESLDLGDYKDSVLQDKQGVQIVDSVDGTAFQAKLGYFEAYAKEVSVIGALKLLNKVKILTAVTKGKKGYHELNKIVEGYLEGKGLIEVHEGFYHNQPIMINQNDYSLGLFNGDVGLVRNENGTLYFFIEDPSEALLYRKIPVGFIRNYQTVYAMTVHKSQGSEFTQVIIVLPDDEESRILSRELIYTAVTRSSLQVLLVGSNEVINASIGRVVERVSGIKERLSL